MTELSFSGNSELTAKNGQSYYKPRASNWCIRTRRDSTQSRLARRHRTDTCDDLHQTVTRIFLVPNVAVVCESATFVKSYRTEGFVK